MIMKLGQKSTVQPTSIDNIIIKKAMAIENE